MTKTRYFQATDGKITVFRASATRVYNSATVAGRYGIGFSASPPFADRYPTKEITKAEYQALVARKTERLKADGRDPAYYTSPQDSWVTNAPGPSRADIEAHIARLTRADADAGIE